MGADIKGNNTSSGEYIARGVKVSFACRASETIRLLEPHGEVATALEAGPRSFLRRAAHWAKERFNYSI